MPILCKKRKGWATRRLEYWTFRDLDGFIAGGRDASTSLGMTELGAALLSRCRARGQRGGRQDAGATRLAKMGMDLEIHRRL